MSLLIQLRYRIKAIDTIKKITHAMRLISMSARSRLKNKEEPLRTYIKTSHDLLARLQGYAPGWKNPIFHPPADTPTKQLIILIGSQRGLCGNFNTTLFHFFEKVLAEQPYKNDQKINLIPIGKKASGYLEANPRVVILQEYIELNARTLPTIAQEITHFIFSQPEPFTQVHVLSNQLKTFFIQKPHDTQLIPIIPKLKKERGLTVIKLGQSPLKRGPIPHKNRQTKISIIGINHPLNSWINWHAVP